MNNKEILNNAPEGATHIEDLTNLFIKVLPSKESRFFKDWYIFEGGEWVLNNSYNILLMRSLADIREIEQLKTENENLLAGDWTPEQYHQIVNTKAIKKFTLEQQAKGVDGYFKITEPYIASGNSKLWRVDNVLVDEHIEHLRQQAKEQGE